MFPDALASQRCGLVYVLRQWGNTWKGTGVGICGGTFASDLGVLKVNCYIVEYI